MQNDNFKGGGGAKLGKFKTDGTQDWLKTEQTISMQRLREW